MSSLQNRILLIAAFFGVTAIAIGAMGAHFLKESLTVEQLIHIETGARYQMYHAIVLLAVGILAGKMKKGLALASTWFFVLGVFCFSFSLYAITFFEVFEITIPKLVFLITPLGGLLLMLGWMTIAIQSFRSLYLRNAEKQQTNRP
jgi:uncharacterized membrane protein YgdD (TMEM256/DUF423 family)